MIDIRTFLKKPNRNLNRFDTLLQEEDNFFSTGNKEVESEDDSNIVSMDSSCKEADRESLSSLAVDETNFQSP